MQCLGGIIAYFLVKNPHRKNSKTTKTTAMLNSNRKYSIAVSYNNKHHIETIQYDVNELLNSNDNDEIAYSCQEYSDDILDLMIGKCIYIPMRDNLGDILIKRLK